MMETRHATDPERVREMDTGQLRSRFLVEDLFADDGGVRLVHSDEERMVLGGVRPGTGGPIRLEAPAELRANYFCERRELGVVAVGGTGTVEVDGTKYELDHRGCLYVGRGARDIAFDGDGAAFYLVSTPAHTAYPTTKATAPEPIRLGEQTTSNERSIHQLIHAGGVQSCQLVLGVTVLEPGSMWNTMPCHTHARRTEVYLYFDLPEEHRIVHLMGEPDQTRNLIVADRQAVISPRWSVHTGFGTHSYAFVWAMGGENQAYDDMDTVAIPELR